MANSESKVTSTETPQTDPTETVAVCVTRCPRVHMYGPSNVYDLIEGELKKWCTCGLSKKQPWCDGAHKGTGFKSLHWTVPKTQTQYEICLCKHTKSPPYCDGTHTNLPCIVNERQANCVEASVTHVPDCKLCTGCGWVPDF